jgi:hypothetical protein
MDEGCYCSNWGRNDQEMVNNASSMIIDDMLVGVYHVWFGCVATAAIMRFSLLVPGKQPEAISAHSVPRSVMSELLTCCGPNMTHFGTSWCLASSWRQSQLFQRAARRAPQV